MFKIILLLILVVCSNGYPRRMLNFTEPNKIESNKIESNKIESNKIVNFPESNLYYLIKLNNYVIDI